MTTTNDPADIERERRFHDEWAASVDPASIDIDGHWSPLGCPEGESMPDETVLVPNNLFFQRIVQTVVYIVIIYIAFVFGVEFKCLLSNE